MLVECRACPRVTPSAAASGPSTQLWWSPTRNRSGRRRPLTTIAMRCIVQRVSSASVKVNGQTISTIDNGLLCFIGIRDGDTHRDQDLMCRRILNTRLFSDEDGRRGWHKSVVQKGYEVLLVSQFTLHAIMKGNRPSFHLSMAPQEAQRFYTNFVQHVRAQYQEHLVKDGEFGAMMEVSLVNDGPVTMTFDSERDSRLDGPVPGEGNQDGP